MCLLRLNARKSRIIFIFTLSLIFLLKIAEASPVLAKHVVVIGIDGLNARTLSKASLPGIESLKIGGAYTLKARSINPSSSAPNWMTILTGSPVFAHGVESNNWRREEYMLPPAVVGLEDIFPTIFSVLKQQKPTAVTGAFYQWEGFANLLEHSAITEMKNGRDSQETTEQAIEFIVKNKPDLVFIHIDDADHIGHTEGHDSDKYLEVVISIDKQIQQIVAAIDKSGIKDETMIFLVTDHGGIGRGHGGLTPEEMQIPMVISGSSTKKQYEIPYFITNLNVAPTIAYILGLDAPESWVGKPIRVAFQGMPEPTNPFDTSVALPLFDKKPGLYIQPFNLGLSTQDHAIIRYTLDNSLPTEQSEQYSHPIFLNKSTIVRARSFLKTRSSPVVSVSYRFTIAHPNQGLKVAYYEFPDEVDPVKLPDFDKIMAQIRPSVQEIDINDVEHRKEKYAIQFSGYIEIKTPGEYDFYTRSDDGSKLIIDKTVVVDNDGTHGIKEIGGRIKLSPGFHKIIVEYFQAGGGDFLNVLYKGPNIIQQIIPPEVLFTEIPPIKI